MLQKNKILLACDLDRTVLPNGKEPLSPKALLEFSRFVTKKNVILAYLSGRSLSLIQSAIREYSIPTPDVAVGDVGTSMYFVKSSEFKLHSNWQNQIDSDWQGFSGQAIQKLLQDIPELTLQEKEKQAMYKQSYYTPSEINKNRLIEIIQKRLQAQKIKTAVIFSIDELKKQGLLDILPISATKKHALSYLQKYFDLPFENVIYAGDSGNDIEALTSGYKAVVVKNAREEVKKEVKQIAQTKRILSQIYFAKGNSQGLNGNYVAGILEGIRFFGARERT